ncbi:hypothetical protein DV702_05945 [Sporosarcina sp. PTS2304]|uniref:hypothetical protein n=1 Tax=Sporosarcina sp. PTS2304 TaxID=2283194 RepID=UPI000E0CEF3A|nr:hypothetical protein [Sporosarcina sp. PTS2304]AXH99322.1 hypothetical protein DV702_05945 [Sporosarcina sp. PTS2304]
MLRNEKGMTVVELLATLLLVTFVSGIIWTTISIATKFNIGETSTLRLQQEANYIISELQQIHRNCEKYSLTITANIVEVSACVDDTGAPMNEYNGVISDRFTYESSWRSEENPIEPTKAGGDLVLENFAVVDPSNSNREVKVSTTISRFKIKEEDKAGVSEEGS